MISNAALIVLCVGATCGFVLTLAYALWVRVRVLRLRQDLFAIRDELFDRATEFDAFLDPAYREARRQINGTIALADLISIPVVVRVSARAWSQGSIERDPLQSTSIPAMQAAIAHADEATSRRVFRYLAKETLVGLVGYLVLRTFMWHDSIAHSLSTAIVSTLRVAASEPGRDADGSLGAC